MFDIDQEGRYTLVIVVVALFAIALAASTITSVAEPDGGDGRIRIDIVNPPDSGSDQDQNNVQDGGEYDGSAGGKPVRLTRCIDFLTSPLAIGGMVGGLGLVLYGIYRRFNFATSLFSSFVVAPLTFGTWAMLTNCVSGQGNSDQFGGGRDFLTNDGAGVVTAPPVSPTVLGVIFGFLVVLSLAVMLSVTGRDETYEPIEDDDVEDPDEADFARAAGRAADRIEEANVAVDNAVYRAWGEMTNLLDVPDPETSTPMDFADAAIEVGLDEDDVSELTELFNEVRYGHRSAEEREERALEVLRHIEATYEESPGEGTDEELPGEAADEESPGEATDPGDGDHS